MKTSFLLLLLVLLCALNRSSAVCPAQIYDHTAWSNTPNNNVGTGTCLRGYGSASVPTRSCSNFGFWSPVINNRCITLKCPADGEWPMTIAGRRATRPCPAGQWIHVERWCTFEGEWLDPVPHCI